MRARITQVASSPLLTGFYLHPVIIIPTVLASSQVLIKLRKSLDRGVCQGDKALNAKAVNKNSLSDCVLQEEKLVQPVPKSMLASPLMVKE